MSKFLIAKSSITIDAPAERVWEALTTPDQIKQYFFGVDTVTDWKEGSPILHRGTWEGQPFEDKGTIVRSEPGKKLVMTHYSPLSGLADTPENYQTVTYTLVPMNGKTMVTLENDNNSDEKSKKHSAENWQKVLEGLKEMLETEGVRPR